MFKDNSITTDTFFEGKLLVMQPKNGYRYSIDSILLAHHVKPKYRDKITDLGTGCAIIPLIVVFENMEKNISICGIEIRKIMAELADENVRENNMQRYITIVEGDFRKKEICASKGEADIVMTNPPYRKVGSGRMNPNYEKAVARHEIKASLQDISATASRLLRTGGKFVIIYPAPRTAELFSEMRKNNIEPKSLITIHSKKKSEAKLIIAEGIKGGGSAMKIESPLIIYNNDGSYTDEVEKIFYGHERI